MKVTIDIDQFSDVEQLAALTQLYLELRLPLQDALRAAEADLWDPCKPGSGYSKPSFLREAMYPIGKDILPPKCSRISCELTSSISLEAQQL